MNLLVGLLCIDSQKKKRKEKEGGGGGRGKKIWQTLWNPKSPYRFAASCEAGSRGVPWNFANTTSRFRAEETRGSSGGARKLATIETGGELWKTAGPAPVSTGNELI